MRVISFSFVCTWNVDKRWLKWVLNRNRTTFKQQNRIVHQTFFFLQTNSSHYCKSSFHFTLRFSEYVVQSTINLARLMVSTWNEFTSGDNQRVYPDKRTLSSCTSSSTVLPVLRWVNDLNFFYRLVVHWSSWKRANSLLSEALQINSEV